MVRRIDMAIHYWKGKWSKGAGAFWKPEKSSGLPPLVCRKLFWAWTHDPLVSASGRHLPCPDCVYEQSGWLQLFHYSEEILGTTPSNLFGRYRHRFCCFFLFEGEGNQKWLSWLGLDLMKQGPGSLRDLKISLHGLEMGVSGRVPA